METGSIALVSIGTLFAAWLLVNISKKLVKGFAFQNAIRAIPTPQPCHWLLGHLPGLAQRTKIRELRYGWAAQCPNVQRISITPLVQMASVVSGETIGVLLRSSEPKDNYVYSMMRPWLGDGLLLSGGRKWARDRRLLTHCFHFNILQQYVAVYNDAVSVMLQNWAEACAAGQCVDVTESCTLLTLDIILRCAMGFESNCQSTSMEQSSRAATYIHSVRQIAYLVEQRFLNVLHHPDLLYYFSANGRAFRNHVRIAHETSRHLIAERRAAMTNDERQHSSVQQHCNFLDVLLTVKDEEGVGLSDEEIREQVDTFLFRGHDTTSSALQWTLYYLSQHEDLQEKCRQEVLSVCENSSHGTGHIEHEHMCQMPYLTQFIKESMRFGNPVPFILRQLTQDTKIDKYTVPEGTSINISIVDCHHNPDHWENTNKFDPDRFSPKKCEGRHPFAFIPFSAGPRNCIGQTMAMDELKTSLACILKRFRIKWDPQEATPNWQPQLVSRAEHNLKLRLFDLQAGI